MRAPLALPSLVVAIAALTACGGSTETPPAQDPTAAGSPTPSENTSQGGSGTGTTTPPSTSSAACGSFGGKIHGTSSCVSMARPSATLTPMTERASQPTQTARCDGVTPVKLATSTVHLECVEVGKGTSKMHAEVTLVIDEDTAHPSLNGKRILLDTHEGFWDFINAWIGDRTDKTEITIDYGVLD